MWTHLIAVLGLALVCAGWIALQRWIARRHPELPGIVRPCAGCVCDGEGCDRSRSDA